MNKENCALKLVDEIILYYDAPSKKHQSAKYLLVFVGKTHFPSDLTGFRDFIRISFVQVFLCHHS